MLLLTSFSDWKQTRGIPVACVFIVGLVGWVLLQTIPVSLVAPGSSSNQTRQEKSALLIPATGIGHHPIPILCQVLWLHLRRLRRVHQHPAHDQ
jgi:hypothetical protein